MLDIYSFINSKYIRTYLRGIDYQFDIKESAWLIYQCQSATLKEKHAVWNQLIAEMPLDNSDIGAENVMLHSRYPEETLKLAGLTDVVAENNKRFVDTGLNEATTFRRFHDWENNKDLYEVCIEIAKNYSDIKETLFVYGPHGCGKTTMLQCLGNLANRLSRRNLLYVTAENFVIETIEAIRSDKLCELRSKYRNSDFLIVDDIQAISGKETSMRELTYTINDLLTKGAQVVIGSDRPLTDLEITEDLKNKLSFAKQIEML